MVNDVDRMYKDEISNATPIAYAMKGPSMTTEIFRKMMGEVMSHCKNKGLNVVATAADGQWHKYGVRDSSDAPLTLFQLQRDFWKATMIMSKSDLLKKIRHVLTVKSLTDVLVERENNSLIVFGHAHDKRLIYSQELSSALLKSKNSISSDTLEEKLSPEQLGTDLAGVINDEVVGSLGEDDLAEVDEIISGRRSISLGVLQNKHDYDVETDPCIDVLFNDDMGERTIGTFDQTDHPHLISVEEAPPRSPKNLLNPLCDENMQCFTYHDTSNVSDQLPHIPECVEVLSDAFAVLYQDDIYGSDYPVYFTNQNNFQNELTHSTDIDQTDSLYVQNTDHDDPQQNVYVNQNDVADFERTTSPNTHCLAQRSGSVLERNGSDRGYASFRFETSHYELMLQTMRSDEKASKKQIWSVLSTENFNELFRTLEDIDRNFFKYDILLCLNAVSDELQRNKIRFARSWS
ncbi:MAG: hypothetical protein AB2693_28475 [Candidatus Thiodiazotropha sp.]